MKSVFRWLGGASLVFLVLTVVVKAEDTKKKWQFGAGFSYWTTDDNIRSNAPNAYAPITSTTGNNLPSIQYTDPRPDANELNQPTIQDSFKFDINASYGITRWVALELSASYFKGDVGNIEFYYEDFSRAVSLTQVFPKDPPAEGIDCLTVECLQLSAPGQDRTIRNGFMPVGKITEVPVMFTGLVRFRPESPFDPYIGGGFGYIFTSLDTSASRVGTPFVLSASNSSGDNRIVTMRGFDDVSDYTNGLQVQFIQAGARGLLTYPCREVPGAPPEESCVPVDRGPFLGPLTATVENGPEYHLRGGVDYYFSDHVSLYIDGLYVWAQSRVKIRMDDGQTQVAISIKDYGCQDAGLPIEDRQGQQFCRTLNGGNQDISNSYIVNQTVDDIQDLIVLQGGDIRLGGFSLGIGAKFTF